MVTCVYPLLVRNYLVKVGLCEFGGKELILRIFLKTINLDILGGYRYRLRLRSCLDWYNLFGYFLHHLCRFLFEVFKLSNLSLFFIEITVYRVIFTQVYWLVVSSTNQRVGVLTLTHL